MAKKISYKEYVAKEANELKKMISEKRKSLQNFRFEVAGGKVTNVKFARNAKKEVARMLTALQNKQSAGKV